MARKVFRMVAAFWAGIPVEFTQEADVIPCRRRAAIGTPFKSPHTTRRETVGVFYPSPTVPNLNYLVVVIVQGNFLHSLLSLIARNVFGFIMKF